MKEIKGKLDGLLNQCLLSIWYVPGTMKDLEIQQWIKTEFLASWSLESSGRGKKHQFSSVTQLGPRDSFVTPWTAARQASLSITNSRSLLKLVSIESVIPSNHLILCRPLLFLPSIFSSIRETKSKPRIITIPLLWYGLEKNLRYRITKETFLIRLNREGFSGK